LKIDSVIDVAVLIVEACLVYIAVVADGVDYLTRLAVQRETLGWHLGPVLDGLLHRHVGAIGVVNQDALWVSYLDQASRQSP
jgi:hypothetical protein